MKLTPNKPVFIDIVQSDEPWGTITLADGTIIKTRLIPVSVRRLVNEKGEMVRDNDGLPMYEVNHRIIMAPQPKEN